MRIRTPDHLNQLCQYSTIDMDHDVKLDSLLLCFLLCFRVIPFVGWPLTFVNLLGNEIDLRVFTLQRERWRQDIAYNTGSPFLPTSRLRVFFEHLSSDMTATSRGPVSPKRRKSSATDSGGDRDQSAMLRSQSDQRGGPPRSSGLESGKLLAAWTWLGRGMDPFVSSKILPLKNLYNETSNSC